MKILSLTEDDPLVVDLEEFFYENGYGWCFGYGEVYGIVEKDLVEIDTDYYDKIIEFLDTQLKIDYIPVEWFYEFLETGRINFTFNDDDFYIKVLNKQQDNERKAKIHQ